MKKLAVFDVDGVLLDTEVGGFKLLAKAIGKDKEMEVMHKEYEKRKNQGPWGLEQLALLFKGISEKELVTHSRKIVKDFLRPETAKVITELKNKGFTLVAYSSNPELIMSILKEMFGFADICGNVLEFKNGIATGILTEKIDRYGKEKRLLEFMQKNGFSKENTHIIGDSVTDIPMAQHGTFIAFNTTKEEVTSKAKYAVQPPLNNILKFLI